MWDRNSYSHFKDGENESREIMGVKSHDKIPNFKVNPFSVIPHRLNVKNIDNPYYSY